MTAKMRAATKRRERLSGARQTIPSSEACPGKGAAAGGRKKARRKRTRRRQEEVEQRKWVKWAREHDIEFAHLNNGAKTTAGRVRLYAMGCAAGAADILIFDLLPGDSCQRGLAMEFKSPGGRQSADQKFWQQRIERCGWRYHVVKSAEEAKAVCRRYGLTTSHNYLISLSNSQS